MQDSPCIKCGTIIKIWAKSDTVKCKECGALYEVNSSELHDQHIEYTYDFVGFRCIYNCGFESCDEVCPAPYMYCEKHTSDESFESARQSIHYAEQRLESAKQNLELMAESKKTWLIQKISGMDE